jgi:adenosine kinase
MLGANAIPMGTVGKDFDPYRYWMDKNKIDQTHLKVIEEAFTGQAFITTDLDDNQITAFHPGAMDFAHENKVADADGISIGIISPDGRDGMIQHASQFVEADIPFLFDPGQGLPMFTEEDLKNFFKQATWIAINDYEWQMMQEKTDMSPHDVAELVDALIVTKGGEGSLIYTTEKRYEIPSATPSKLEDPTGCGDAYRAGLLYGLMNELDWETIGRIASLMGAIKIESHGTQNHSFTMDTFRARYQENFDSSF